jgi:hypothetical protein
MHCALHGSTSEEVRNGYEHDSDCDEKKGIGDEIRKDHEGKSADKRDDSLLLLSVHEEAKPD